MKKVLAVSMLVVVALGGCTTKEVYVINGGGEAERKTADTFRPGDEGDFNKRKLRQVVNKYPAKVMRKVLSKQTLITHAAVREDWFQGDKTLLIVYHPSMWDVDYMAKEMGKILNVYYHFRKAGYTGDVFATGLKDDNGTLQMIWYVRTSWIDAYRRGDISKESLVQRVLATAETPDENSTDDSEYDL